MAADVLCPAPGAGGEATGILGDAAEHPSGTGQRKVPGNAAKRQLPGAGVGLLCLGGLAVLSDPPQGRHASFEWDEEKERINFRKHGIHFKTAARVFLDPYKLIREDEEHLQELRYDILGKVGKVLFVVCAFRECNVVRLISARLATVPEKERYEHGENEY